MPSILYPIGCTSLLDDLLPGTWATHCENILGYEPVPDVGPIGASKSRVCRGRSATSLKLN